MNLRYHTWGHDFVEMIVFCYLNYCFGHLKVLYVEGYRAYAPYQKMNFIITSSNCYKLYAV